MSVTKRSMARRAGLRLLLVTSASVFGFLHAAHAQTPQTAQVHVQGAETGQGVLRARGTECFVITPFHVVEASLATIGIVGEVAVRAQSQLERRYAADLAILRIDGTTNLACASWPSPPDLDALLATYNAGFILTRESDGSLSRMSVALRASDTDSIYVRPTAADDRITRTMSGSSLVLGGEIVGILLSVEGNEGRIFQLDDVIRLTAGFFSPSSSDARISRAMLESLVGDYNAGSIVIRIGLRPDGTLTSQAANTPPSALLHERDLRFKVEADPRVVFEFRRDRNDDVFALFSHQPNGIVPAIRQSNEGVSREQLKALIGLYHAGDAKFVVELDAKGGLTFAVQGHPHVELLFARDRHFVVRGSGGAYIEFVRDPGGVVTGLVVHGATPIFASRFR